MIKKLPRPLKNIFYVILKGWNTAVLFRTNCNPFSSWLISGMSPSSKTMFSIFLFLVTAFHFWNCISRFSKDHFFAFEEEMKNKASFEKGRVRCGLDMVTGGTYMKLYSIKNIQKRLPHYKLGCGGETFFKLIRRIINNLRCTLCLGTP